MRRSYVLIKNLYSLSVNILTKIITTHLTIESEMICSWSWMACLMSVYSLRIINIISCLKSSLFHVNRSWFHLIHYADDFRSVNLIATLSSFNYFNRLKQSTGISYCDITRYNFNSIYSLISDKPCFIAIKHKTLKLVGYLFFCV